MTGTVEALEVTVTAPVVSFRNPLYAGIQKGLPCPPPATIGGMLAAAAGGWQHVAETFRFAAAFTAAGAGVDLETYHPLTAERTQPPTVPKDREFLFSVVLTVWLLDDLDRWEHRMRRPVWPVRLGRSQDLASARTRRVRLTAGPGEQRQAIIPAAACGGHHRPFQGLQLQLPTAVSAARDRTRWDAYRYASTGVGGQVDGALVTADGHAVVLLPPAHPGQLGEVPVS